VRGGIVRNDVKSDGKENVIEGGLGEKISIIKGNKGGRKDENDEELVVRYVGIAKNKKENEKKKKLKIIGLDGVEVVMGIIWDVG
jgi:hypothetical protein